MSNIIVIVSDIKSCDSLHIVKFDFHGTTLSMMSLDLNEDIKVGVKVRLVVKPTHVVLAKDFVGEVSYSNQLESTIISCNEGELLCSIQLKVFDTHLESIITAKSSKRMNLKVGDRVTAFIKASELSIVEVVQ